MPVIVTNHTVTIAAELVGTFLNTHPPLLTIDQANEVKIVGQCEISHPVHTVPVVSVVDSGLGQEDPDSMGRLLVQKKNVLFEADGKETAVGLPSPISSKSFTFWVMSFLTCANAQEFTTSTPTGTRYTRILILISSQISL